eukprot:448804-Pyramimonas_sp.AAC.1
MGGDGEEERSAARTTPSFFPPHLFLTLGKFKRPGCSVLAHLLLLLLLQNPEEGSARELGGNDNDRSPLTYRTAKQ